MKWLIALPALLLLALFTLAGEHRASAQRSPLLLAASGMTTCDIGPPVPTSAIPPGAKLSGFTHCAANFDFSQPLYATLSNWFDCDGTNPNVLWHKGSAGVSFVNPCNIFQKVDTATSRKVVDFEWLASYGNRGNGSQANQIGGWTYNNFNHRSSFDVGNYYIETTSRLEQLCPNCAKNSGGPDDIRGCPIKRTPTKLTSTSFRQTMLVAARASPPAIAGASRHGQIWDQTKTPCRPAIVCSITTAMEHFRRAMAPRRNTSACILTMSCKAS